MFHEKLTPWIIDVNGLPPNQYCVKLGFLARKFDYRLPRKSHLLERLLFRYDVFLSFLKGRVEKDKLMGI